MKYKYIITLLFLGSYIVTYAQKAQVHGIVLNEKELPISNVVISDIEGNAVKTNEFGYYQILLNIHREVELVFSHEGYQTSKLRLSLKPKEVNEVNILLMADNETLSEIMIHKGYENRSGTILIAPFLVRQIPGANAGVENLLKILPGVNSNDELSTQYSVRGGSYDENLVYVNGIEVYRPFLIRSGQQEGLSFVNSDMVDNISFSAGGFQAKYGDKLSSVLDITYRTPERFQTSLNASFLGGSATVDLISKDKKWSNITSFRYRDNKLLVNSKETETNFSPRFLDLQTIINYKSSSKWLWSFLGNISTNKYDYEPLSRQTNFGTLDNPTALVIHYNGKEKDSYKTFFGSIKGTFNYDENTLFTWTAGTYHTREQEYYDIEASYYLGEVETNFGAESFGDIKYVRGVGSQLNHARNDYDALLFNTELNGLHKFLKSEIEWGVKYSREDIKDRMVEWEVIDSAGYLLPDPLLRISKDEPYEPFTGPLLPYQNIRANNSPVINRLQFYGQWGHRMNWKEADAWVNLGVRGHYWNINEGGEEGKGKFILSPRLQFAIKPHWDSDILFRFAAGVYQQPPSYREFRAMDGTLNLDLKAQKSAHVIFGNDYSFTMWNQPFKLMTEVYYKKMTDVNTYTLDNVRIRYRADNEAKATVYGMDLRLYGAFVPGTESWLSIGYMKAEENYNDQGVIARPTDQRLKFGLLFQDYMPSIPNFKLYLNLVYNTGLPGGSPSYADPYQYQDRLRDYRRVDAGFSYVFKDSQLGQEKVWLKKVEELSIGFEIYNLFDNQNAITNTWVRDVYTKNQYGIPNYMTTRTFNLKINLKF